MENRHNPRFGAVARRLRLAQAALTWERLWPALWPSVGAAGLFLALALFGVFAWLPLWAHVVALLAFVAGLAWAARHGFGGFVVPTLDDARRRLEVNSGFSHRPLEAIADSIVTTTDPGTLALWQAHQRRALEMLRRLRVGLPQAGLGRHDPRGLRAALALVLVIGFVYAGPGWQNRLWGAFTLTSAAGRLGEATAELTAWIAPPAYTGVAPMFLAQPANIPLNSGAPARSAVRLDPAAVSGGVLKVPVGSTFFARVHGGAVAPEVHLDGAVAAFDAVDIQNFQVNLPLRTGSALAVSQGRASLGKWQIEIIGDAAPTAMFTRTPSQTPRMALQVNYLATDDYGVHSGQMKMRRTGDGGDVQAFDLVLPGILPKHAPGSRSYDLTPHPWAGLEVTMWLEAIDSIGQVGKSEEFTIKLPERAFRNPVAQAIIEQRRNLAADPANRDEVAFALDALTEALAPEIDDFGTYLDLRSQIGQLTYDRRPQAVPEVIDRLWDAALRLEEGELGPAERQLRMAQQALQDALNRDAPQEELERLMAELQEAMDRYLQELAEQAERQQQNGQQQPQQMADQNVQQMTREQLQQMLDQAREMAQLGAREQAQQMLQQLQRMLENLQAGRPMQQQNQQQQMADQAMRELGNIIHQQQQLMDQTFQQAQRGQFGERGQLPSPQQQEALRQQLGEMMRGLGERTGQIPQAFGEAERAMRGAAQALEGRNAGKALAQQGTALDRLRETQQQMMQQFMAQGMMPGQQNQQGQNGMTPGQRPNPNVDPLGRPMPGMGADISNRVAVPDKADLQRAREILEELFRRAGERFRAIEELDYLNRLLRRF
jgi:uncharacterized protein (TIGR02302 family)